MPSNYAIDYKVGGDDAKNHGWVPVYRDFPNRVKKYYSDKAEADTVARNVATALNVKTRVRTT